MHANPCLVDILFYSFRVGFHIACEREKAVQHDAFILTIKSAYEDRDISGASHMQKTRFVFFNFGTCAFGRATNADFI